MEQERWIPPEIPLDKPNAARIYDFFLGGYHNFAQDRAVAERLLEVYPYLCASAQANRAFLRRTVNHLLAQGIDQFLDIGSGIPTMGNVHEVAQAVNPEAHVVYVDIDPVAVAHCRTMLIGNDRAVAIHGDVREPEAILAQDEVRRLLDLERPVGLLLIAVLHYVVDDDDVYRATEWLRGAVATGSCMALAHSTFIDVSQEEGLELIRSAMDTRLRDRDQVLHLFGDWPLVEPGLVFGPLWRPEGPEDPLLDEPQRAFTLGGVACKEQDGA
jgi:hypothetical protein